MVESPISESYPVESTISKLREYASPAAARNAIPIAEAISPYLPKSGLILEVGAGIGYHGAVLAAYFPHLIWQPTDSNPVAKQLAATVADIVDLDNLLPLLELNAELSFAPFSRAAAILCCNMIHIAPWAATEGLMRGASKALPLQAALFLYGPFMVSGEHTSSSNAAFDLSLKAQNPAWGVRDTINVDSIAKAHGMMFERTIPMPANNVIRVYRRIS